VIDAQTDMLDQFGPGITGFSIAGNVVTFTAQNTLPAGTSVTISGLTIGTYLNGQTLTVLPAGLNSTQFEAAFTHANVASTVDSGTAAISNSTIPVGVRPVWADLAPGQNELVVANEGTGTTPGSVSIISIPLCSSTALQTNPNCDSTNPIDASTFGQTVATVPVGINPIMVSVLSDSTRAYVANAGTGNFPCSGTTSPVFTGGVQTAEACTVSVVNLLTDTVTSTIGIGGHPVYIAATDSTPAGKVYVVCKDSQVMTVIKTDTDSFYLTIPLQGYGVSVRVSSP
jgi:DNA-binding beta-propeller fold protein YncE